MLTLFSQAKGGKLHVRGKGGTVQDKVRRSDNAQQFFPSPRDFKQSILGIVPQKPS